MSKTRQSQFHGALVRTFAVDFHAPQTLSYKAQGWDLVVHATQGVLSVSIDGRVWVLPSHQALWVPHTQQPTIHVATPAKLRSVYLRPTESARLPKKCWVMAVTRLFGAIAEVCASRGILLSRKPADRRLAAVLRDQLLPASGEPLEVPQPRHPDAQRFAAILRNSPPDTPLRELARLFGASLRTLERLFEADLGLSLAAWRRRLRLQKALEFLAMQKNVAEAAYLCGYSSASAFVSMFRREFGITPARYFRSLHSELQ